MTELMGLGAGASVTPKSAFMAEFFSEVEVVKAGIAYIE